MAFDTDNHDILQHQVLVDGTALDWLWWHLFVRKYYKFFLSTIVLLRVLCWKGSESLTVDKGVWCGKRYPSPSGKRHGERATGLVESKDGLPLGLWLMSPVGWLPRNWDQLHAKRSYRVWHYTTLLYKLCLHCNTLYQNVQLCDKVTFGNLEEIWRVSTTLYSRLREIQLIENRKPVTGK